MTRHKLRYGKGDHIGGRYLVHQALMGGMGEVYLCSDLVQENYPYALKTFQNHKPGLREIFESEISNWIALEKHPHIVQCFGLVIDNNTPFMVLEWVAGDEDYGADLRGWLRYGPLELALALRFTIDIVRGLQHANHKSPGIVHRDLKPDNVLVNQSQQAKITDFGLATVAQAANLQLDASDMGDQPMGHSMRVGNIVGTPPYMAPEQWRGETDLDHRTDMYAIGCILYEILTGRWVYNGKTISELKNQHLHAALPELEGKFPLVLKQILDGCLTKERVDRFGDFKILLKELSTFYETLTGQAVPDIRPEEFNAADYGERGVTYSMLGQYERAIEDFDQAIHLDPNLAIAYYNRGLTYGLLNQHDQAINNYDRAIQLNPNYASAYLNRGKSCADLGQHQQAINDFTYAINLKQGYTKAYYNRGNIYVSLGQYERAIDDYEHAITLDPHFALAYLNKGVSLAIMGHLEEAIKCGEKAIALGAPHAEILVNQFQKKMNKPSGLSPIEEKEQAIYQMVTFYQQHGEAVIRETLKLHGIPNTQIEAMLLDIKRHAEENERDEIELFIRQSYIVYKQHGEIGLREMLRKYDFSSTEIDEIVKIAKQSSESLM